jgi:hypothetical protein
VSGDSQNPIGADHFSRALRRQIVLANVHALQLSRDANIRAVIHDQDDVVRQSAADFTSMVQHLARRANLVAILNEGRAAGCEIARVVNNCSR